MRPTTTDITIHESELWKFVVGESWPYRGDKLPIIAVKTYKCSEWCTVTLKNKERDDE